MLECLANREILCGHRPKFSNVSTVQVCKILVFFHCLYSIVNDRPFGETSQIIDDQMVRMLHLYTNPQATNLLSLPTCNTSRGDLNRTV